MTSNATVMAWTHKSTLRKQLEDTKCARRDRIMACCFIVHGPCSAQWTMVRAMCISYGFNPFPVTEISTFVITSFTFSSQNLCKAHFS